MKKSVNPLLKFLYKSGLKPRMVLPEDFLFIPFFLTISSAICENIAVEFLTCFKSFSLPAILNESTPISKSLSISLCKLKNLRLNNLSFSLIMFPFASLRVQCPIHLSGHTPWFEAL